MLPKKLMSLHDIPKRKEKRTIALCDKKQPGYVRCGWDTDTHTATTAAAPSTSTPPSADTAQRQLLLLVCGRVSGSVNATAKHAPASVLLDSLLHGLFRLVSPAAAAGAVSTASQRPRNGHVRGIGLFLYQLRLQLRKFWRRIVKRRKRALSSDPALLTSSTTYGLCKSEFEYGATSSNDARNGSSDDICGDGCEHVSQLLRRRQRRPFDRLQQQWLPNAEQSTVREPTSLPEPPSAHSSIHIASHLPTTSPWPGDTKPSLKYSQRRRRRRRSNISHAPSNTQPKLERTAEAVQEQADRRAAAGCEEPRRSTCQFADLSAVHPDQVPITCRRGSARDHMPDVFLVRPQRPGRVKASAHMPQCQGLRLRLLQSAALVPHNATHRFR